MHLGSLRFDWLVVESKVLTDQVTNLLDLFALTILLFSSIFATEDDINVISPEWVGHKRPVLISLFAKQHSSYIGQLCDFS